MKWRKYYCINCKQMTAYAAGGIVGEKGEHKTHYMKCDECGYEWEEVLIKGVEE